MRISTKGRYALRLLVDLAQHPAGELVSLRDVAQRQEISQKYLEQIAIPLSQAGLLRGARGSQGGYTLVHRPEEITLLTVLTTVEGPLAPVPCLQEEKNCERSEDCLTRGVWQGLDRTIRRYLESVTLRDVVEQRLPEEEGT